MKTILSLCLLALLCACGGGDARDDPTLCSQGEQTVCRPAPGDAS